MSRPAYLPTFFFRTKKTNSGEYLQLVKTARGPKGGKYSWGPPRKQSVVASLGRLEPDMLRRLRHTLNRIAEKKGVTA